MVRVHFEDALHLQLQHTHVDALVFFSSNNCDVALSSLSALGDCGQTLRVHLPPFEIAICS